MTTIGSALADAVSNILGIDKSFIIEAEISPTEARITRGVHMTNGGPAMMILSDGGVDIARVTEVFDMQGPVR